MTRFSGEFLAALGTWQQGWREKKELRLPITARLLNAIKDARDDLPDAAFKVPDVCYRKRFLVPNNPQNGGDFVPLTQDDSLTDGVASWTTDFDFAKKFKENPYGVPEKGKQAVIFMRNPRREEIVLNITELWTLNEFQQAVRDFADGGGENAGALLGYKNDQFEVILNAPLLLAEIHALLGAVPRVERVCELAGIEGEEADDAVWAWMKAEGLWETQDHWVVDQGASNVVERFRKLLASIYDRHGMTLGWGSNS